MHLNCVNLCCSVSIIFLFTYADADGELKNQSGTSLIDGNCINATDIDRVYYGHVSRNAIPLIIRSETDYISVGKTIYCMIAQNQKRSETGGTAEIIAGGVGHKSVLIYLESFRGNGLDFYISIYAKKETEDMQPAPSMPVALD